MTSSALDDAPTVVTDDEELSPTPPGVDWDADLYRVHRYVLLDRLGAGAFGVVRAAYDPELDRKVAIKLMRRGMVGTHGSTTQDRSGLVDEARMAAKLSHPNVVAIYDIGSLYHAVHRVPGQTVPESMDGVYIVMEHLGGRSLCDWIAARPRSWREIIDVFVDAGRGLAAAHELGMVHRDFKPANLRFGDDGRIRVLDFGLARLERQLRGNDVKISGTPRYMAPEQHRGEAVTASADQYALCVSLWNCLYGTWPHEGDSLQNLGWAKQRAPEPPSSSEVPSWVGQRLVRGLAPRPEDRFDSIPALLDALQDDPGQRRRRVMAGGALAVVLVGGGYGLAVAQPSEDPCALRPDRFTGLWDADVRARVAASFARTELPYAEAAVEGVARGLDEHLAGWAARRTEVCRASLDRGERSIDDASRELECLDRQLRRVAALSASFQNADDAIVLHAPELVAQLPTPRSCVGVGPRRREGGASQPAVLELEERIAAAENLATVGDFSGAQSMAAQSIARAQELGDDASRARALLVQSLAWLRDSRYPEARASALQAHALALALGDVQTAARALVYVVSIHRARGEYDQAELVAEIAQGLVDQAGPTVQVDLAFQLGALAEDRDQWDLALTRLADARARAEALYGEDHLQIADIVLVQGIANSASQRDFDAALAHFEHAHEIFRAHYGELHPRVASIYNNVGGVYFRQQQYDRALPQFRRALEIYTQTNGEDHPLTVRALSNLGLAEYKVGQVQRGVELTRRSLELRAASLGQDNPEYVSNEANFAVMLEDAGQLREALERLEHVHARKVKMLGEGAPGTLLAAGQAAVTAERLEDEEAVRRYYQILLDGIDTVPADDPQRIEMLGLATDGALRAERWEQAEQLASLRHAAALERYGPGHPEVSKSVAQLAAALLGRGRAEEALARLEQELDSLGPSVAEPPDRGASLYMTLGRVERALGRVESARQRHAWVVEHLRPRERFVDSIARAHLAMAELATDHAERRRHAQACLEALAGTEATPSVAAKARALLGATHGAPGRSPR